MRIAIISDIHDRVPRLRAAMDLFDRIDTVICCGDLCAPFVVTELAEGFAGPVHIVFGNVDGDRFRIAQQAAKYSHVQLHGEFAELELGGKTFAVNHFDHLGRAIAGSQKFDVVCFGHTHKFEISQTGSTMVINPGEIYGLRTGNSTFVVYDTESGEATRVDVE